MRPKIVLKRTLIEKSILKNASIDKESIKNQFLNAAVLLKEKMPSFFNMLMNFENMELSKEDLILFKLEMNKFSMFPMTENKHKSALNKEFGECDYFFIKKIISNYNFDQFIFETKTNNFIKKLKPESFRNFYYLYRNLGQEKRIRKAILVLIKYTNREVDSLINKSS